MKSSGILSGKGGPRGGTVRLSDVTEDRPCDQASVNHRLGAVDGGYRWERLGALGL